MTDVAPSPETITVALRFRHLDDAERLRRVADRAMVKDLRADVQLYRDAAAAVDDRVPFKVVVASREDLHNIIIDLVSNGIEQPSIEWAQRGVSGHDAYRLLGGRLG